VLPASSMLPDNTHSSEQAEKPSPGKQKWRRLLYCNYHIEMKIAHGELKHGGQRQAKSQLLAESLARSLELKNLATPRKVLFSLLTDCCSLYVKFTCWFIFRIVEMHTCLGVRSSRGEWSRSLLGYT
jgi:hypothetical protein